MCFCFVSLLRICMCKRSVARSSSGKLQEALMYLSAPSVWHSSTWACRTDLSTPLNPPKDHLNTASSPRYTFLHLWNWRGRCGLLWMGLQWAERQALPWSLPNACLSNGCDMWVGQSTLRTLRLIDEDRKIFLWPGMEQPGGLPLTFFICANWYVWGNVHARERDPAVSEQERESGENYAFLIPKFVLSKTSRGVW